MKKSKIQKIIVKMITDHYLNSNDFNGIQIWNLQSDLGKDWDEIKNGIQDLIKNEEIQIIDEQTDTNPNIIRVGFEAVDSQIAKTNSQKPGYMCLYPTPSTLKIIVNLDEYEDKPYKLRLALGEAQLSYATFDLSILEFYRNDPRYKFKNDDIYGRICYDNEEMKERDKAFLETYGFAYDSDFNRVVAVFICYLAKLTPEHQQIWKAKEVSENYKLHPDYYRSTIYGAFGERIPICQAFLMELFVINRMAEAMGRPIFFRKDYGKYGENRPNKFHFLIRPTLEEFNSFILLFDKMISDNINKKFFMNEIEYENEEERNDGKTIVTPKGTIQLLDEWFRKFIKFSDEKDWDDAIKAIKTVRKLRQQPAHSIKTDEFNQKYFKEQRMIILEAYKGIRLIRSIFANHPEVKDAKIDVPVKLQKGNIWSI